MKEYKKFLLEFNKKFSIFVKGKIKNSSKHSKYLPLNETYEYVESLSVGGKRLRPYLVHLASKDGPASVAGQEELMFAVELLHLFCLIHDDIMDKSKKRHGIPTANFNFGKKNKDEHLGNSLAILLGDVVFLWCVETINSLPSTTKNRGVIIKKFYENIDTVIYGQGLDLLLIKNKNINRDIVEKKMNLKTSNYSFYFPMLLGFLFSGKDLSNSKNLKGVADHLGAGFQIKDDLLDCDLRGKSDKSLFLDIESGQHTMLSWYMSKVANTKQKREFYKIFNKGKISGSEYKKTYDLLDKSGAIKYCEACAREHFDRARRYLERLSLKKEHAWIELTNMIEIRNK